MTKSREVVTALRSKKIVAVLMVILLVAVAILFAFIYCFKYEKKVDKITITDIDYAFIMETQKYEFPQKDYTPKYHDNDTIIIDGKVTRLELGDTSYGLLTLVYFENEMKSPYSDNESPLLFWGNLLSKYKVGKTYKVPIHFHNYFINDQRYIFPDELIPYFILLIFPYGMDIDQFQTNFIKKNNNFILTLDHMSNGYELTYCNLSLYKKNFDSFFLWTKINRLLMDFLAPENNGTSTYGVFSLLDEDNDNNLSNGISYQVIYLKRPLTRIISTCI